MKSTYPFKSASTFWMICYSISSGALRSYGVIISRNHTTAHFCTQIPWYAGGRFFLSKNRERSPVSISSASPSEGDADPAESELSSMPPADPLFIVYTVSCVYACILMVCSGLSDIVLRPGVLSTSSNRQQIVQNSVQAKSARYEPRIQDMTSRITRSIMRLNETFLDSKLGKVRH